MNEILARLTGRGNKPLACRAELGVSLFDSAMSEMAMFRQLRLTSAQKAKNTLPPRLLF